MRMGGMSDSSRMGRERAGSLVEASDVSIWPIKTRVKSDAFKGQAGSDLMDKTNSYLGTRETLSGSQRDSSSKVHALALQ